MVSALLLFLTLPVVFSADPKCPEGFHYFKRVPTAWNNYTKEWCLGVIDGKEDCSNRDFARSICINHNATISMPENKHEFEFVANVSGPGATKMNHAIDGQMSPRCVNKYMKHFYFFSEEKGECNLKRGLFLFDDINTDPSYVLDHAQDHPTGESQHQVNKTTAMVQSIRSCLGIYSAHETKEYYSRGGFFTEFCFGQQLNEYNIKADYSRTVVCGRPPL
ncbi:hypothetical protein CAEBREN_08906 [Caenorhabditis brenneri]|uniref:Uncharacterized protein n=1 Tax=Caenorhabditis brenneri TaxID=135651 RepID=G0N7A4_CAEBE|nr:hypothetical protein CAEBREN_08906 [Caenorhabditis brenneri]